MPEYTEETVDNQINESILEQEFNIETTNDRRGDIEAINEMRRQLMLAGQEEDPDVILLSNIERANNLLDIAYDSIVDGEQKNARLFEVCAQLINAITSAATSVQNSTFGIQKHEYNMQMVEVKRQELIVKQAIAQGKLEGNRSKSGEGGRIVTMSREEVLKLIDREEMEVEIESVEAEENTES